MLWNFVILASVLVAGARCAVSDADIPELKFIDDSVDPCDDFYKYSCGNFKNYYQRDDAQEVLGQFTLLADDLVQMGAEILSTRRDETDPVAFRKAKAAYQACVNTAYADNISSPELEIVVKAGGMPMLSEDSNLGEQIKFSWNELGDLVAEYGVPLVFEYSIVPQTTSKDGFWVYVSIEQAYNTTVSPFVLDHQLDTDQLSNPTFVVPETNKGFDRFLSDSMKEDLTRPVPNNFKSSPRAGTAPFDIFLRSISKKLIDRVAPWKTDAEMISDLDEMANFMRQLYAGGIVEEGKEILPLSVIPTLPEIQNWTEEMFPNQSVINWADYLGHVFGKSGVNITESNVTLLVYDAQQIYGVLNLVHQTDPKVLKNFALLRLFLFLAPDSDASTRQAFEDYYKAKNYVLYPRSEYCARKILDMSGEVSLNFAVTYGYQQYHYNNNNLFKALRLVKTLTETYEQVLQDSDWMDDESKVAAMNKIKNMIVLFAFPDFVEDTTSLDEFYENMRICTWDNYGNSQRLRAFKQAYLFNQIGRPRQRTFWDKSTFDPNAFYNRPNNKIVLPISMLNPIFFNGSVNIIDYSRLGAIIGHEVTHGFDNQGSKYNEEGLQKGAWWSNETIDAYNAKTQCFIDQYNKYYIPELDKYVDGTLSLDENLADNGGIRNAYKAYQALDEVVDQSSKYTIDQLFYIGYATMWCDEESTQYLNKIATGVYPYSPNQYRVNGAVSNQEEFARAFGCPSGSPMNPTTKCNLW